MSDAGATVNTLTIPAMTNVYHYHFSGTEEPFTLGCYGPVADLDECKGLYDNCGSGFTDITVKSYDQDSRIKKKCFHLRYVMKMERKFPWNMICGVLAFQTTKICILLFSFAFLVRDIPQILLL